MKNKKRCCKKPRKNKPVPFLVLPLIDQNRNSENEMAKKKPELRLFTKIRPPAPAEKNHKNNIENSRPLTATLDKPQVLDIKFIRKIDMSLMRKEFLSIANLCRVPLIALNVTRRKPSVSVYGGQRHRPLSLPPRSKISTSEDSGWEDESSQMNGDANNNYKTYKKTKTKSKLPEPCKTCGRSNQPERFHSHPVTPLRKDTERKIEEAVKTAVQKPLAIKYQSKKKSALPVKQTPKKVEAVPKEQQQRMSSAGKGPKTLTCYICAREFGTKSLPLHEPKCLEKWKRENESLPQHLRRKIPAKPDRPLSKEEWNAFAWESSQATLVPCENCGRTFYPDRLVVHQRSCKSIQNKNQTSMSKNQQQEKTAPAPPPSSPPGPRHVSCSVCGRKFGTKSIKIHEPQCLKKWHAQNDHLPPNEREPMMSQRDLGVPAQQAQPQPASDKPSPSKKPPMFPCYLCGRLFSVNSIYIHEPQCLKKWKVENDKLPPERRRPVPMKPEIKFTHDGKIDHHAISDANWLTHLNQLVPCKSCGRTFNPDRVEIHERSCKAA